MRITHICLNSVVTDGWNYQDNMLTKYHAKAGHDVSIITSKWVYNEKGKLECDFTNHDYINQDKVRVIRLPMKGKEDFTKKIKKFQNFYSVLCETRPDVLFIHSVNNVENDEIVKYLRKNIDVIAYADNHADLTNSGTNWFSKNILHKIIWKHYAKKLIPYVRKFYGVLPVRVDFLTNIYGIPKEKCDLLVMGAADDLVLAAESDESKLEIRHKYGFDKDDFLIVTGGKIDFWKTETLELMKAVNKIGNNVKLLIFGSVDEKLKNEFESLLSDNVKYCGWVKAEQSYKYFAAADLVAFPGRHSVFWEQVVAQGIPMICKDLLGTHHVDIGGNVLFLKNSDYDSILEILKKIITDDEFYLNMKNAALATSKNKFLYSKIAALSIEED